MDDVIFVRDLLLRTIIGINPEERVNKQDVLINLELRLDTRLAGESDNIADTVNYRSLVKEIIQLVEQSQFYLIERLAAEIARVCLDEKSVRSVCVCVEKPLALRFARSVGVKIERGREANT